MARRSVSKAYASSRGGGQQGGQSPADQCAAQVLHLLHPETASHSSLQVSLERGLLVSDAVQELHTRMSQGGMRAFSHVKLSTCHALLELLYEDPRFYGSLDAGGTLLAAGVVAAAMAVCCRPSDMTELAVKALMDWLADLSTTPKDVILIQAEQVLEHTLAVTKRGR